MTKTDMLKYEYGDAFKYASYVDMFYVGNVFIKSNEDLHYYCFVSIYPNNAGLNVELLNSWMNSSNYEIELYGNIAEYFGYTPYWFNENDLLKIEKL